MYKITFVTGKTLELTDEKYHHILDLKKRGMLNPRQKQWLFQVKDVTYLRQRHTSLQAHRIHQTKDLYDSDCAMCYAEAKSKYPLIKQI